MRLRELARTEDVVDGGSTYKLTTSIRSMSDVNNGKKGPRPNSPCYSRQGTYEYIPVRIRQERGGGMGVINCPVGSYLTHCEDLVKDQITSHEERFVRKMNRLIDAQIGSFSSLNFLYELKDLQGTFKKFHETYRNIPVGKGDLKQVLINTGQMASDSRFIDWQFAVQPMLNDIKSALQAYNNQVAGLNEKLSRYRSIPCRSTLRRAFLQDREVTYFAGNGHFQADTLRLTSHMTGSIEMDVPWLSQVSPELFRVLDDLRIDVSAGNAWDALPWSWFVDWFLPIGDFLESLPSSMKPQCRFVGTWSHKIVGFSTVTSLQSAPAEQYFKGQYGGRLLCNIYSRKAFSTKLSSLVKWRLDSLTKPSQLLILRDIMLPANLKKGKSALAVTRKKVIRNGRVVTDVDFGRKTRTR